MERRETSADACDGCQIVGGRVATPGGLILEDAHWHVTHVGAPAPLVRGMLVMRARRHVIHLADLTGDELAAAASLIGRLSAVLRDQLSPERLYCWFFGEGSAHAHFVLMPRFAGMPAGDPLASLTEVIVARKHQITWAEAEETAAALRAALRTSTT